jgi:hypothetical protein
MGMQFFNLRPIFQERIWDVKHGLDMCSWLVPVQTGTAEHAVADLAYAATSA